MSKPESQHLTRRLAFCLLAGLPPFSLVSALEVLRHANRLCGWQAYSWHFLTEADEGILDLNGLWLQPDTPIAHAPDVDLAVVIAGFEPSSLQAPMLSGWLKAQARRGAHLAGLSNGNFLLAAGGLLDGYAATVHWEDFSSFHSLFPRVKARYQRFVMDRERLSCSGGAATLDLFIEIVRDDLGLDIARKVSRQMLLQDYAGTVGQQVPLVFDGSRHFSARVQRALKLLEAGVEGVMSVATLADSVGVSQRELLRLFRKETGKTPQQILNERKLERARSLVLHSHLALAEVATAVGFSSQSHMTMRYRDLYGVTPGEDRKRRLEG